MVETIFRINILPLIGSDVEAVIEFLKNKGLLKRTMFCDHCNRSMVWRPYNKIKDKFVWKCEYNLCEKYKTTKSIRSSSFFEGSRLELQMIIFTIYLWSENYMISSTVRLTGLSRNTVIIIYDFLRSICTQYFENYPIKLGGPQIICQIDESLFTHKQKYHRGRISDHQTWVFGIVDTSFSPARGFMKVVESRNKLTLLPIIENICLPGTIIHSDQWAAYREISDLGFKHDTVNHSENFINPSNGVHTQHIESYWNKQKLKIKAMKGIKKEKLQSYLDEYMWMDSFKDNSFFKICDLIEEFYSIDN